MTSSRASECSRNHVNADEAAALMNYERINGEINGI